MVRSRRLRTVVALIAIVLPPILRRFVLRRLLGHQIDRAASIGFSFVDADELTMAPGASIGHLTVIRGCERVVLERDARIGHLNLVNGLPRHRGYFPGAERDPALVMRELSYLTTMHFVDCSDRVELAYRSGVVGCWSVLLTHTIDHRQARQTTAPVAVGIRSLVATRCTLLPGSVVGERCIVAAGTVVPGPLPKDNTLYGGAAARPLRDLDPEGDFFRLEAKSL